MPSSGGTPDAATLAMARRRFLHLLMGVMLIFAFCSLLHSHGFTSADILAPPPSAPVKWAVLFTSPSAFRWEYNVTPCSSLRFVAGSLVSYIGFCFALQWFMSSRQPFLTGPGGSTGFTLLVVLHNVITSVGSWTMLCGILHSVWLATEHYEGGGVWAVLCDEKSLLLDGSKVGSALGWWSYIYYEMLDTVVLALKKRPLEFLQMYHHASIVMLCWSWLQGGWTLHWYGMVCNTTVHTFMYYYFAMQTLKKEVWWKKYLTMGQLLQFSTVFMLIWYFAYAVSIGGQTCAGASWIKVGVRLTSRPTVLGLLGGIKTVLFAQFVNMNCEPRCSR
jgi:fatty acid elongase 3